ncbi:MAG: radical SAM protein [Anaerolineales bacterium]|nr:radical SAM protein [Chloroflexota bacterium]MBL6980594.1 radical SAM protein [Anaerolineales bacterium]
MTVTWLAQKCLLIVHYHPANNMNSMNGFSWTDFEMLRRTPLATMGIFTSSYCPVGCAHCAVSASSDSLAPSPDLLMRGVEEMVQVSELKAVAITGGEPFAEFELLESLVDTMHKANKRVVIYTSGYWGKSDVLQQVSPVLQFADGLVLGIDLYHRAHIPAEDLINALRTAKEFEVWVTAQVISGIDGEAHLAYARQLFQNAFGPEWHQDAHIIEMPPLPSGRAEHIDSFNQFNGSYAERCYSVNGPTLLRDGTLAACCNEDIVLHNGPDALKIPHQGGFSQSLEKLESQPTLGHLRRTPPAALASLAAQCLDSTDYDQSVRMCQACWDFVEAYSQMDDSQLERFDEMVNLYHQIQNSPLELVSDV